MVHSSECTCGQRLGKGIVRAASCTLDLPAAGERDLAMVLGWLYVEKEKNVALCQWPSEHFGEQS